MERFKVLDRELDYREFDGIEVSLKWEPGTGTPSPEGLIGGKTSVDVADKKLNQFFRIQVPSPEKAYDVFHHPFSYYVELEQIPVGEDYGNAA
jgi:hypothetical protein